MGGLRIFTVKTDTRKYEQTETQHKKISRKLVEDKFTLYVIQMITHEKDNKSLAESVWHCRPQDINEETSNFRC